MNPVLVTFDNKMPIQHRACSTGTGQTLAVVDRRSQPAHMTAEQYWRDVIHRHAHRFATQTGGTLYRYGQRDRRRIV